MLPQSSPVLRLFASDRRPNSLRLPQTTLAMATCLLASIASGLCTTGQQAANFIYPVAGQQNVDTTQSFQWTTASGAVGYYLYVGTSVGAPALVNSGVIQATSRVVPALPPGVTLYARIYTQTSSGWLYQDITFTAAQGQAMFTFPLNGQQNVDTSKPFQWTPAPGALAYNLNVGSTLGGADLLNTGPTQATSYQIAPLAAGMTVYARIWTQTSAGWQLYQDISFITGQARATFIYPINGQQNVDTTIPFSWTPIPGSTVLGYYLYVGTSVGAKDLINSGVIQATSRTVSGLPVGVTLYARIYTQTTSGWLSQDITFTAAPAKSTFIFPLDGRQNVDTTTPFQWTATPGALAYNLNLGTTAGGSDLLNTGPIQVTSYRF